MSVAGGGRALPFLRTTPGSPLLPQGLGIYPNNPSNFWWKLKIIKSPRDICQLGLLLWPNVKEVRFTTAPAMTSETRRTSVMIHQCGHEGRSQDCERPWSTGGMKPQDVRMTWVMTALCRNKYQCLEYTKQVYAILKINTLHTRSSDC